MVESEPNIIPNSSAINIVPAPTPLRSLCDKSAVQANNVGLEIPVARPKTIAAVVYIEKELAKPISNMLTINIETPKISVFLLPILSDKELVNNRIIMVEIT